MGATAPWCSSPCANRTDNIFVILNPAGQITGLDSPSMEPCADALLLLLVFGLNCNNPAGLSVREALTAACVKSKGQGITSLTAPNELTGEDKTIEGAPKDAARCMFAASTRKVMKPHGAKPQSGEKLLGGIRFRTLPLNLR